MRSLKIERKARNNPRAKAVRHSARAARELPKVQPGSARREKGPSLLGRIGGVFRRPMLALAGLAVILTLLAGLLVSGVIGRTAHGVGAGVSGAVRLHFTGTRTTYVPNE